MEPAFALTLSEDGIGLQHRGKGGWKKLGDVSLDDPGLGETLKLMRGTAEGLAGGRLLTKLVIPDSQVLYTTLPVTGDSPAEKRASLRRGLDGLTPYALDDLVFDWQETGAGTARLAVVARETLVEAEAFAAQHRFNPVCLVACPSEDRFAGEAFFGPTALAATLLSKNERPEPEAPASERQGGRSGPTRGSERPAAAKATPSPAPKRKPKAEPPVAPPASEARPAPTKDALPAARPADPAVPFSTRRRAEDQSPPPSVTDAPTEEAPSGSASRLSLSLTDAPGRAADAATSDKATPKSTTVAHPTPPTARMPPVRVPSADPDPVVRPAARIASFPPLGSGASRTVEGHGKLRLGLALTGGLVVAMAGIALWSLLPEAADRADAPITVADTGTVPDTQSDADLAALPDDPAGAPAEAENIAPPTLSETEAAESYATTGLWQLAPEPMTAPPPDRIEDLFVAALDPAIRPPGASVLPDPRVSQGNDLPLPLQADPPGQDEVFVLDERGLVAATPEGALTPDGVLVFSGQPPLVPRGRTAEPVTDPEAPGAVAESAAETAPAAPVPDPSEAPEAASGAPAAAPGPAPAVDTELDVIVTEGPPDLIPPARPEILVTVTEGRPRLVPPPRPQSQPTAAPTEGADPQPDLLAPAEPDTGAGISPEPEPTQGDETGAAQQPSGDTTTDAGSGASANPTDVAATDADPALAARLAAIRPRLRPANLVPDPVAAPPASAQAAATPGLRPVARPAALAAAAPPPPVDRSADIEAALADAIEAEQDALASALAIARSPRPASRPSDLASGLAALAPAVPAAAAVAAPRIPTTASVARQATLPKAINLRQINLIGVYGSSGERRALVRLANGRYEKVKVGDRLDGGQVAAIGESDLRYVKNGRNVVLDLPGR
ncbi:hypothetical protein NHN26_04900 [Rhodovulum tesquicola]|uniref:hypothetical protein n=1 Tax=Rhodovulum tesquicola TaxID=540254 RepID=UPI00209833C2|nr:hypothetical protein [Rhodovulum tesquicola]MCO8144556.1 hypothetical protein [Rhodovulum tesquicola]